MIPSELNEYKILNSFAEKNGIVILGGKEDKTIPLDELRQAFSLPIIYNRSFEDFCLQNALNYYDEAIAPIAPKCLLLHITQKDFDMFESNNGSFDLQLRLFISYIRDKDKKCKVVIVSLKNFDNDEKIAKFNNHLKDIANSEQCEFGDISTKRVWNPQATKDISHLIYDIGFVRTLNIERPIYDLLKVLYFYNTVA